MANVLMQGFDQPSHIAFGGKFVQPQKQQVQQLGGIGGVIERLLPAIGSVGGAVGGSLIAPGVGTAAGGAGGAVLGQKLEDMLTGQHTSAGGYAGQAALGTLGGVGKGLGAIKGGVQAARAGEGIGGAAQALRFGTKGAAAVDGSGGLSSVLTAAQANTGKGAIRSGIQDTTGNLGKQTLLSQAPGLGKGTAESAVRDVQGMKDLGYSNMATMAKHAPFVTGENGLLTTARNELVNDPNARRIDTSSFLKQVQDHIDNNPDLNPAQEKKILGQATKLADKYGFQGDTQGIGSVHPANFNSAMKDVFNSAYTAAKDSPARKTLVDIGNSMRQPLKESLDSVPFTADHKNGIIQGLIQSGVNKPQVIQSIRKAGTAGDLANIESKFVTASNIAKDSAENSLRAGINMGAKPGLTQELNQAGAQVIGKPVKTAISAVSGGISKLAGAGGKQAPENLGQLVGQTAKSSGLTQAAVRTPGLLASFNQPKTDQSQVDTTQSNLSGADQSTQTGLDQSVPTPSTSDLSTQSQNSMGLSPDLIQKAMVADLANGGKNVGALATLYNTFVGPKSQPQLSADQQKRVDNMNQAGATLQEYYNQLQQAGGGKGLAIGPAQSFLGKIGLGGQGAAQAKALEATRVDIATTLAQAMTGNSRPAQQQVQLWMQSIPQISDPQPVAKQKLQNILGLIQSRQGAIGQ
jgi:hypothetical protein